MRTAGVTPRHRTRAEDRVMPAPQAPHIRRVMAIAEAAHIANTFRDDCNRQGHIYAANIAAIIAANISALAIPDGHPKGTTAEMRAYAALGSLMTWAEGERDRLRQIIQQCADMSHAP